MSTKKVTTSMSPCRRLAFRFLTLPFRHQMAIARRLNILTNEELALSDDVLFRELFKRAAEKGLLGKLWVETEKLHSDPSYLNPFETSEPQEAAP